MTEPLDELAEYLRGQVQPIADPHSPAILARWLSALERTRQDARRYRHLHTATLTEFERLAHYTDDALAEEIDAALAKDAL